MFTRAANQNDKYPADTLDNIDGAIRSVIEKLFAELQRLDAARAELDAACGAMSPTARRQLGGLNVGSRVAQRYRAAILEAVTGMLPTTGAPKRPDFSAAMDVLKKMRCALDTISATAAGGGKNRKLYRAVGMINGVSGLSIEHDEIIALLDTEETQKLLRSGVLQIATEETTK